MIGTFVHMTLLFMKKNQFIKYFNKYKNKMSIFEDSIIHVKRSIMQRNVIWHHKGILISYVTMCVIYRMIVSEKKITHRKIMQDTISRNVVINMLCSWNNVFLNCYGRWCMHVIWNTLHKLRNNNVVVVSKCESYDCLKAVNYTYKII